MVWKHQGRAWDEVRPAFERLLELRNCLDRDEVVRALRTIVPEYEPLNPPKPAQAEPSAVASASDPVSPEQ
jgi:hypothetical protein